MPEVRARRGAAALPWIAAAGGCLVVAVILVAAFLSAPAPAAFAAGITPASASLIELQQTPHPTAAPDFSLTDQHGSTLDLRRFRGRSVVLTFNDDECTDLCTLLAEDVLAADRDLGSHASDVAYVSVNANPFHTGVEDVRRWTDQHGLRSTGNWYYGTGSAATLARVAQRYGCDIEADRATGDVVHCTTIWFIDPNGHEQAVGSFGSDSADTAPFAHAMAQMAADLTGEQPAVAGPSLGAPARGDAEVGDTAPALDLALAAGPPPPSTGYRVVDFFSSTCTACRPQLGALETEQARLGAKVAIVGVDVDDQPAAARSLAAATHASFSVLDDPQGAAAGAWTVSALPTLVVLDPSGKVVIRHTGAMTVDQLDYVLKDIDPALQQQ
ncbi:redoxin domain-containing protein [Pseudolysinimonas sp.]|uniref:redoxin domain-containing protein n=1 Tax=Pseudolysinimonas sp. TaxID=2680009 RepID=UPI003F7E9563